MATTPVEASGARVAIGLPLYNGESFVEAALESLLAQTYENFVLVLLDDVSPDRTLELAQPYAEIDPRVSVARNDRRLGLIGSWNRAFELATAAAPHADYFAWGSDHDLWHPRWLETLVAELDGDEQAVLAYPLRDCIDHRGHSLGLAPRRFQTPGGAAPRERLRATLRQMSAGNMVYGLYRVEPLRRSGLLPYLILPDRFLLTELSLAGAFRQPDAVLWHRRYKLDERASIGRQRRSFYPGRTPWSTYLPWPVTHAALMMRKLFAPSSGLDVRRSEAPAVLATFVGGNLLAYVHKSSAWRTARLWIRKAKKKRKRLRARLRKRLLHLYRLLVWWLRNSHLVVLRHLRSQPRERA
jgi:glycosyltransferase involved in cell wall biosynthesis